MNIGSTSGLTVLLLLAASTCVAPAAAASTVGVQDGTLTLLGVTDDPVSFRLVAPFKVVSGGQEPPGTWHVTGRTGRPGPAAGCEQTPYDKDDMRCSGVRRVDIAFGGGADHFSLQAAEDPKVPIMISGGDGPDELSVVTEPGDVAVDGGPGADTIMGSARVSGGTGDDQIRLSSVHGDPAGAVIDCGPGNDRFTETSDLPAKTQPTVDAATCPPILRAIGKFRREDIQSVGIQTTFGMSGKRNLRIALFRAAEPVTGTVRFRQVNGKPCGNPTVFRAGAREEVRVTLAVPPSLRRLLERRGRSGLRCTATVTGTDDEGEPVGPVGPYANFILTR